MTFFLNVTLTEALYLKKDFINSPLEEVKNHIKYRHVLICIDIFNNIITFEKTYSPRGINICDFLIIYICRSYINELKNLIKWKRYQAEGGLKQ
jgi:hypothetical protein